MFMNEYEITDLAHSFDVEETPYLAKGAEVLKSLMDWTNRNSDGWPYWNKPSKSALRLMEILNAAQSEYYKGNSVEDITEEDLRTALRPVKSFLTRQGVNHVVIGL